MHKLSKFGTYRAPVSRGGSSVSEPSLGEKKSASANRADDTARGMQRFNPFLKLGEPLLRSGFGDLVATVEDLRETQNRRPRFRAFPLQFPAHGLAEGGSNVRCTKSGKIAAINLSDWSIKKLIDAGNRVDGLGWTSSGGAH
jgi:hypothetical protein